MFSTSSSVSTSNGSQTLFTNHICIDVHFTFYPKRARGCQAVTCYTSIDLRSEILDGALLCITLTALWSGMAGSRMYILRTAHPTGMERESSFKLHLHPLFHRLYYAIVAMVQHSWLCERVACIPPPGATRGQIIDHGDHRSHHYTVQV